MYSWYPISLDNGLKIIKQIIHIKNLKCTHRINIELKNKIKIIFTR